MDDASREPTTNTSLGIFGLVLIRIVVPVWILAGALFKFASRDPALLPKQFRALLHGIGLDLKISLAILLGIEIAAVAVMLFVPRLARLMAVVMLFAFIVVLVNEMIAGNIGSCGCLGSFSPPPWIMLAIDVLLLILVVGIRPADLTGQASIRLGMAQASIVFIVAAAIAFAWVLDKPTVVASTLPTTSNAVENAPTIDPATPDNPQMFGTSPSSSDDAQLTTESSTPSMRADATAMPTKDWYELDTTGWVGKNINDIDLVQYTRGLPSNLDEGDQYLIYYSRTCDHCQMLLEFQFGFGAPVPTTLVAVPETAEGFTADDLLDNPCLDCQMAELPTGVNWLMTPPLVMALRDGEVICVKEAEEADIPECLSFH